MAMTGNAAKGCGRRRFLLPVTVAVIAGLGPITGYADQLKAFTAFALERCLPAMALESALPTDGLHRLADEARRSLVGDAAGALYASETPFVVLQDVAGNVCAVLALGADTAGTDAFMRFWFDRAPWLLSERSEQDGDREERYVWARDGLTIRAIYSSSAPRGVALLTIHREAE